MFRLIDGAKIVTLRTQKGWSQQELAEQSGVNGSVISRMERNLQDDFKLSAIHAIANALDITIDDLLTQDAQIQLGEFVPELETALRSLSRQSVFAQKQVAAIINAYLSTQATRD